MKKRAYFILVSTIVLTSIISHAWCKKTKTPNHPSKLRYDKLDWQVPLGKPYRTECANGLKLYIAEDNSLPVVTIVGLFRVGSINDPKGKEGLGSFATHLMRTGGTEAFHADSLDALIDHFAMSYSLSLSESKLKVTAKFLSQHTDTALFILKQILFKPAFNKDKIEKERGIYLQRIKHRFDNPGPILSVGFERALYPQMPNSRLSTANSIKSITKKDCQAFHQSVFRTENCILAISGDISSKAMIKKVETLFPIKDDAKAPIAFPPISCEPKVQYLIVQKKISQAYVRIGQPLFKRPHPDYYALSVFNSILGAGSFTSRLVSKIRSDEGLTYSIRSKVQSNYIFPGTFNISFFTKHATVNKAIALSLKEVDKILTEGITKEELANTKKVFIDGLPSSFRNKDDIVDIYSWNEYYGRPDDLYQQYPKKINALSIKDVTGAAKKHIDPTKFVYVIVGDTTELFKAEAHDGYSLRDIKKFKVITPSDLEKAESLF